MNLTDHIRRHTPECGQRHIDAALSGDADAIFKLACAMHSHQCVELVVVLNRLGLFGEPLRVAVTEALAQSQNYRDLVKAFKTRRNLMAVLTMAGFSTPPGESERLFIYRGVAGVTPQAAVKGLSWTLSLGKADWFAHCQHVDGRGPPVVVAAEVDRSACFFIGNDRGEQEVIPQTAPRRWQVCQRSESSPPVPIHCAAYHEAGHAVAAVTSYWVLRRPIPPAFQSVNYAKVKEHAPGQWRGLCSSGSIYPTKNRPPERVSEPWRQAMQLQLIVNMAGPAAEAVYRKHGKDGFFEFAMLRCGMAGDFKDSEPVLADLRQLTGQRHSLETYALSAYDLMVEHWPAVRAVANVLVKDRFIYGNRVELIARSRRHQEDLK